MGQETRYRREPIRIILAGGPSCGKTSVVKELRKRGYTSIDEAAREVIREGLIQPGTAEFQIEIFRRQIERENNSSLPAFFDRSALEGVAYSRKYLTKVPEIMDNFNYNGRYAKVLLLERLPFQADGERVEKDDSEAEEIHQEIASVYRERGFNPIDIPLFKGEFQESLTKRVNFILEVLRC
jgi:predicted ATPase